MLGGGGRGTGEGEEVYIVQDDERGEMIMWKKLGEREVKIYY